MTSDTPNAVQLWIAHRNRLAVEKAMAEARALWRTAAYHTLVGVFWRLTFQRDRARWRFAAAATFTAGAREALDEASNLRRLVHD